MIHVYMNIGQPVHEIQRYEGQNIYLSPGGTKVATVYNSFQTSNVRVMDIRSQGGSTVILRGHTYAVYSVAFSPDGRRVVSGSSDNKVRIWDAASGECVVGPLMHGGNKIFGVTSVAFSPDGKRAVSGASDKEVRIWNTASGQLLMRLDTDGCRPSTLLFSSDMQLMACGAIFDEEINTYRGLAVHTFKFDVWELDCHVIWYNVARNPVMYRLDINATLYNNFVNALDAYLGPYIKRLTPTLNENLMRVMLSYVPHASFEEPNNDVIEYLLQMHRRI